MWENRPFTRLVDWSYELGLDRHSQSVDPQFVNPAGPDGVLGYSTAAVGAAQILNDKAAGFTVSGDWDRVDQADGGGGTFLESAPVAAGSTAASASWTVEIGEQVHGGQALNYPVSAFWSRNRGLGSATYSFLATFSLNWTASNQPMSGTFNVGGAPVTVNQAGTFAQYHSLGDLLLNVPNPPHDAGTQVSGTFTTLAVTVRGGQNFIADEFKVKDFVKAEQQQNTQGLWIQGGLAGDYYRRASGGREDAASWTVAGLTPGAFYEVSSTWLAYATLSNQARFFVYNDDTVQRQITVDQTLPPGDFLDAGVGWKRLSIVQATGTTMTVKLSAQANGAVIANAIRFQEVLGDTGLDDDFHLPAASPSVDRGNPADFSYAEPAPNGDRVDQGAYGNTPQAASSPSQLVQVLSPSGLEKLQVGQQVPILWRSAGLTPERPVALIDAGSSVPVENWAADTIRTFSHFPNYTPVPITQAINLSGVAHPAPQAVYQTYAEAPYSTAALTGSLSYGLQVPDGAYTVRLHFAEPNASASANFRKFHVQLQGTTVLANYDVFADAGAVHKATEKNFTVTATGGAGIQLNLVSCRHVLHRRHHLRDRGAGR